MSDITIFSKIKSNYNVFTKAEKDVADFILKNPKKVLQMSITDLADACNVGDTSVFRFCKTLELQGYQDFKMNLALNLTVNTKKSPQLSDEILIDDSIEIVTQKILTSNIKALNETFEFIDNTSISLAVDYMLKADRILFFGVGASAITALEARNRFMRITPKTEYIMDSHLQSMAASLMKENDLAIAFSYSGSTKDTILLAKQAKKAGAKLISITRFNKSPLTSYSDLTLLCGANEGPLQGGSLSVKISQLYLLDILYVEYFKRTFDVSKHNKELTSESVLDKLY